MGGRIEGLLSELGLTLPEVAAPVAAYVPAVLDADRVWTSGQLPFVGGALPMSGLVGNAGGPDVVVDPAEAAGLARICALNALAAAGSVLDDLDRIQRVIKLVGFVASDPSFTGQPMVINGASELFGHIFPTGHARSAVGVAALPLGAPVEVEVIFGL